MGRAIVREPQCFLMDEPLSNLDAKLRVQMRAEIARIQQRLGVTTVYVTHDQTEAMTLGHRVAVIKLGVLQQVAPPQELYDRPVNLFVGGFIGSPAMNMIRARVEKVGSRLVLQLGSNQLPVPEEVRAQRPAIDAFAGREVVLGIRPEDMEDAKLLDQAPADRTLTSTAELVEAMGSDVLVHFSVDAATVVTEDTKELARDIGESVDETPHTTVVARVNPRTAIRVGEPMRVVVDTLRMHLFDLETGLAIWTDRAPKGVS
jgi:multiple sugar transport system ATP-binding protein